MYYFRRVMVTNRNGTHKEQVKQTRCEKRNEQFALPFVLVRGDNSDC